MHLLINKWITIYIVLTLNKINAAQIVVIFSSCQLLNYVNIEPYCKV